MINGVINWYDADSKCGSIISTDNIWYRINEFTLLNNTESLKSGDKISFTLSNSSIHPIVTVINPVF